ncbi:MAG: hypothetical protein US85_C0025G0008 [Candidatus Shapirobacteria bacterium GW2011_GWF1_38_23]|nr:MAG: hypothetical protein US85_C0025G0008 [Candidatus Shapirobacteria bacterium GW2011_GWF1_38_23]
MNETEEYAIKQHKVYIDEMYESIIEKIQGGRLFGDPIDKNDIKQLVVSAYLIGEQKVRLEHITRDCILDELRR